MKSVRAHTDVLEMAYEEHGPADGPPVFLMHGFPYDLRCFDEVAPAARHRRAAACWCLICAATAATRFLLGRRRHARASRRRLGHDLLQFMDALAIKRATLAGYDWGGRGSGLRRGGAMAWRPGVAPALVSCTGYNIQNIKGSGSGRPPRSGASATGTSGISALRAAAPADDEEPPRRLPPAVEALVAGLGVRRGDLRKESAASFDNPDFVPMSSSSPTAIATATRRATRRSPGHRRQPRRRQPAITVPTINLHGGHADGVGQPPIAEKDGQAKNFTGGVRTAHARRGSAITCRKKRPGATVAAIRDLMKGTQPVSNIALIGATGGIGSRVLDEALARVATP